VDVEVAASLVLGVLLLAGVAVTVASGSVAAVSVTTTVVAVAVTVETSVHVAGFQSPLALFHQLGWLQRRSRAASLSRGAGMATAEPATTAKTERALTETMFAGDGFDMYIGEVSKGDPGSWRTVENGIDLVVGNECVSSGDRMSVERRTSKE
jgi:hypothetical protein